MSSTFGRYASFYDVLYADKDYEAECDFLQTVFGDLGQGPVRSVVDLGCGTGIFSVGAIHMGAKKVFGFDIDKNVILAAKKYAKTNALPIAYTIKDVTAVDTACDTVLMNPPFGAQKSNQKADRKFLEKAFEISRVIYSLHLKKTIFFLEKMINVLEGEITNQKDYVFPIKWMFGFHDKEVVNYDVILLRITTHP